MNRVIKSALLLLGLLSCYLAAYSVQSVNAVTHTFPVAISTDFVHDQDGKWRAYVNVTVVNNYQDNITIDWIQMTAENITYIDNTFEDLGISAGGNATINQTYRPGDNCTRTWTITDNGFEKQPKSMGVTVESSIQGFGIVGTSLILVPEFPSTLIVPLFMIATLAVVIWRRRGLKFNSNQPRNVGC